MAKDQPQDRPDTAAPGDDALCCAACDHRITERAYRREMSGAREHTFVNPAGYEFRIGCFVAAPGCAHTGVPSEAFSWFPGWRWQVAICQRCHAHLGWIFRLAGEQFHALILAALR